MNLERLRHEAYLRGDTEEVARLDKLIAKMDSYRVSFGNRNR